MEMSSSKNLWKYGLLVASILIGGVCVSFISYGVVALGGVGTISGAYITASIGFYAMTVSALGCFASIRESYNLSIAFIICGLLSIIIQTVSMIGFATMKDGLVEMGNERVNKLWLQELDSPGAMDNLQRQYKCCGRDSPQDYLENDDDLLPDSCCVNVKMNCTDTSNIFKTGCGFALEAFFDNQSDNLMLSNLGIIAFMALGMASAYFLARALKQLILKAERKSIST